MSESDKTSTIDKQHKPTMEPKAKGRRDAWLRAFAMQSKIGQTFGGDGAAIGNAKSVVDWLVFFKVLPKDLNSKGYDFSPIQLRQLYVKLAEKYSVAAGIHATLTISHSALMDSISQKESDFITKEEAKYKPGGEFWDKTLMKPTAKKPPGTTLQSMAASDSKDLRKTAYLIKREAEFFHHCMMNLETQRRCLKDYGELLLLDPTTRNL